MPHAEEHLRLQENADVPATPRVCWVIDNEVEAAKKLGSRYKQDSKVTVEWRASYLDEDFIGLNQRDWLTQAGPSTIPKDEAVDFIHLL